MSPVGLRVASLPVCCVIISEYILRPSVMEQSLKMIFWLRDLSIYYSPIDVCNHVGHVLKQYLVLAASSFFLLVLPHIVGLWSVVSKWQFSWDFVQDSIPLFGGLPKGLRAISRNFCLSLATWSTWSFQDLLRLRPHLIIASMIICEGFRRWA